MTALAMLAVFAFSLSAAPVQEEKKPGEKKYTSEEGNFAIQYPAGMKVSTREGKQSNFILKMTKAESNTKRYSVSYMELPQSALANKAATMFDLIEQPIVNSKEAKILNRSDIVFGKEKFPAREMVVEVGGMFARTQIIHAGPKIYMVGVFGSKDFATGKEADEFFKSFEILTPPKTDK
jgi:hypothetical protein